MMTRRSLLKRGAMLAAAVMLPQPPKLAKPVPIKPALLETPERLAWVPCDGRALSVEQYPQLGALLNDTYGSAGSGTFRVPNFLGRALVGARAGEIVPVQLETLAMRTSGDHAGTIVHMPT